MKFYVTEKIGRTRSKTPEGFLLCEGVRLARTGELLYGPGEVPVDPGPDRRIRIERDSKEVFSEESMASVNGKPLVVRHPDVDVSPDNWRKLTVGVVLNPRQGKGADSDFLLGDLLITDKDAIEAVDENKITEVSCGYDADYDQFSPGHGRQYNIIYNHVALVDSGRCGPRCAIGDEKYEEKPMQGKKGKKLTWKDRLARAFRTGDAEEFNEALEDVPEGEAIETEGGDNGDTHVHIHVGGDKEEKPDDENDYAGKVDEEQDDARTEDDEANSRFEALENQVAELASQVAQLLKKIQGAESQGTEDADEDEDEEKDEDEKKDEDEEKGKTQDSRRKGKGRDSATLANSFRDTVAQAEILSPGIRIPTYDSAKPAEKTVDALCKLRRRALDAALTDPEMQSPMVDLLRGRTLDKLNCSEAREVFGAAVVVKKNLNNKRTADTKRGTDTKAPLSIADVNKRNAEYWQKH